MQSGYGKPALFWLMVILSFGMPANESYAGSECYNEKYFPAALEFELEETSKGIEVEVQLGGAYTDLKRDVAPVLVYRQGIWTLVENRRWAGNAGWGKCRLPIPKWETIPPLHPGSHGDPPWELESDESPSSCAVTDIAVWFGINFYQGEGMGGYGGLGRYERQTNKLEIRRPPELKHYPIHKVVWDGEHLWAATTFNFECAGHPPALGLIKYKWDTQELTQFKGRNDGPCGFVIHDLLWSNGLLWVATDVGLSRWDAKSGQWTHYLPDIKTPGKVRQGSCETFYKELLSKLPKNETWFDETKSYYEIFYDNLKEFRPDFIKLYESK